MARRFYWPVFRAGGTTLWRAAHGGIERLHWLLCLPALSVLNLFPDAMHIFCLGITHHVLGNVMF